MNKISDKSIRDDELREKLGYDKSIRDDELREKLGFNRLNSDKFNFAVLTRLGHDGIEYQDFWILSNAYYDYNKERFIKILKLQVLQFKFKQKELILVNPNLVI